MHSSVKRFGLPLVLFTVVDNHGLTNLIAGCLLCNEKFESYQWALTQLKVCIAGDRESNWDVIIDIIRSWTLQFIPKLCFPMAIWKSQEQSMRFSRNQYICFADIILHRTLRKSWPALQNQIWMDSLTTSGGLGRWRILPIIAANFPTWLKNGRKQKIIFTS